MACLHDHYRHSHRSDATGCTCLQLSVLMRCALLQVLIEMSLLGWKEYELEVMRDLADNVVIICSIENVDPMGVHTGDSITIAPAQVFTSLLHALATMLMELSGRTCVSVSLLLGMRFVGACLA